MISQQAKDGFEYLLGQALKGSLVSSGDSCDVQPIEGTAEIKENKMVVLTISSYLFRLMVMIHFRMDPATRAHFAAMNRTPAEEMDQQTFLDVIGECGNICCGALNRELAKHFPHIGMSTPNVLDRHSVEYLQQLGANHIKHFRVALGSGVVMHASLAVCDYADLHFVVDKSQAEESTGELEFF